MRLNSSAFGSMWAPGNGSTWQDRVSRRPHLPASSRSSRTTAISSRASVSGWNPPVSTSTTTGRKPRNRRRIGWTRSCIRSSGGRVRRGSGPGGATRRAARRLPYPADLIESHEGPGPPDGPPETGARMVARIQPQTGHDVDPAETEEWLESLEAVLERDGVPRAHFLIENLIAEARRAGANLPYSANTAYLNTIPESRERHTPGDPSIEWRIRSLVRWNAMAMVVQANRESAELGGHIASFASAATLYEVGFNHFWRAPTAEHGGDLVYIQGHSAPGIYARAFLEGRLQEEDLHRFRQEADGSGLSSYPHPWLMPSFWQFPTVSMGLGPIQAIYHARFMRYLHNRGMLDTEGRKVWCFAGDGEMDEPESLGAITLAAREQLDNLVFVVNCNLQRLDGPVRGNGKIIQELEAAFRGAGWNVIKVIWGSYWDALLMRDTRGLLRRRMEEAIDGEYQNFKAKGGGYTRENFFGKYPELKQMVANMSDDDIWRLNRGGHDPHKVYAAYAQAVAHRGQPTVILAKTVKGYGMGDAGEGQNVTHQQKKMGEEALRAFRDRFRIPLTDDQIADAPFYRPPPDSPEIRYLKERRRALGGFLPARADRASPLEAPASTSSRARSRGAGAGRSRPRWPSCGC